MYQALDTVIGNGSSNIAAFSQDASKQLQVAVQALQSSIQAVESTADNSHKADAALAHQLGSAAGSIKQEASGKSGWHEVHTSRLRCVLGCFSSADMRMVYCTDQAVFARQDDMQHNGP